MSTTLTHIGKPDACQIARADRKAAQRFDATPADITAFRQDELDAQWSAARQDDEREAAEERDWRYEQGQR